MHFTWIARLRISSRWSCTRLSLGLKRGMGCQVDGRRCLDVHRRSGSLCRRSTRCATRDKAEIRLWLRLRHRHRHRLRGRELVMLNPFMLDPLTNELRKSPHCQLGRVGCTVKSGDILFVSRWVHSIYDRTPNAPSSRPGAGAGAGRWLLVVGCCE